MITRKVEIRVPASRRELSEFLEEVDRISDGDPDQQVWPSGINSHLVATKEVGG
jgi:hypothetical protein